MNNHNTEELKRIVYNSSIMLMYSYDKIVKIIKDISGYIILFILINTLILFANINSAKVFGIYIIIQILLITILLTYACMLYRQYQRYSHYYKIGFKAWCQLSDKIDWSPIRKKILYGNNETETTKIINRFYHEIQKTFSPQAARNYFILFVSISIILFFVGLGLCFYNIMKYTDIIHFIL